MFIILALFVILAIACSILYKSRYARRVMRSKTRKAVAGLVVLGVAGAFITAVVIAFVAATGPNSLGAERTVASDVPLVDVDGSGEYLTVDGNRYAYWVFDEDGIAKEESRNTGFATLGYDPADDAVAHVVTYEVTYPAWVLLPWSVTSTADVVDIILPMELAQD